MKKTLLLIIGLLILSCNEKNKEIIKEDPSINISEDKEKLRYLKEVEWPKAYREQDTILLDRILGDDFQMVTNDGEWSNKKQQLVIKGLLRLRINH